MSGAGKMRHTEVIIKDGSKTQRFSVPKDFGNGIVTLIRSFLSSSEDSDTVPVDEVFPDLKDPKKRIGIVFRGIRAKFGLTQIEVGKRLGLAQTDVSKIEKGKRPVGKALAKKVQKEFGIDYRRLL